jgi:hypothetical protein
MKAQHQQVEVDRSQTLTEFIKEGEVNLTRGVHYMLTDMAVTSDNKLLLCNYDDEKVYIYTRITKPMKIKYRLPVDLVVLL